MAATAIAATAAAVVYFSSTFLCDHIHAQRKRLSVREGGHPEVRQRHRHTRADSAIESITPILRM